MKKEHEKREKEEKCHCGSMEHKSHEHHKKAKAKKDALEHMKKD